MNIGGRPIEIHLPRLFQSFQLAAPSQPSHEMPFGRVRPYKCNLCEKSFTQRCSLESHCLKVHGVQHSYAYKERRSKVYVCEECGHTTGEPEFHYVHLKENHPYSPALLKFYDKRHFKFQNTNFTNMLLMSQT
ncbi:hypothetical protein Anas_10045 [Armadillidium nasatum]|uniref:C2H2-type domain-containing protein n=1 Tax=Armadillidium nasatum TaxID=96803 RepID=A0A5N5SPM6_9CRUS|nr:hypothetical protein Anas_10045 [Armadillidium nasatum]